MSSEPTSAVLSPFAGYWPAEWQKAVSIFDMVELSLSSPGVAQMLFRCGADADPYLHFNRRIGVHAGITLYNLHRVLCFACGYDPEICEAALHVWTIPNITQLYANGTHFRREAKRCNDKLFTDKTVTLSSFLPPDAVPVAWPAQGFTFEYALAGVPFTVTVTDLLKGHTAQQDLLWVPRVCEGSYGAPPPLALIKSAIFLTQPADSSLLQNTVGRRRRPDTALPLRSFSCANTAKRMRRPPAPIRRRAPATPPASTWMRSTACCRKRDLVKTWPCRGKASGRGSRRSGKSRRGSFSTGCRSDSFSPTPLPTRSARCCYGLPVNEYSHLVVGMSGHFSNLLSSMKRRMGSREQHGAAVDRSPQQRAKPPAAPPPPPLAEEPALPARGCYRAAQSPYRFAQLPALKDVAGADAWRLFRTKTVLCGSVVFNFAECLPPGDKGGRLFTAEIEAKRATLQELLQHLADNRASAQSIDAVAEDIVQMVACNIFRPLPPPASSAAPALAQPGLMEEEADATLHSVYLTGWVHLQPVYEIFLTLVVCPALSPKVTKRLVDQAFVLKLLDLFGSEDAREREYLKTISHRLYGKIMNLRSFIRRCIENIFVVYIDANQVKDGVSELLEILGSIINGFAQPLKEEHIHFLKTCMIPLHKVSNLFQFHQQLSYCMIQYIEKDNMLITPILLGLLRYWPLNNTPKEVLFINEIEDILEILINDRLPISDSLIVKLFKKIQLCIISQHFQISERTLFLWNNPKIVKLVNQYKHLLYPILIEALYINTQYHWNFTVHSLSFNVSRLLAEADPRLYAQCNEQIVMQQQES